MTTVLRDDLVWQKALPAPNQMGWVLAGKPLLASCMQCAFQLLRLVGWLVGLLVGLVVGDLVGLRSWPSCW